MAYPYAPEAYATKNGTVSTSVIDMGGAPFNFTAQQLKAARNAIVVANAKAITITWDGVTDPTATLGLFIAESASVNIEGNANIVNLKFVKVSDDATVTVMLEK